MLKKLIIFIGLFAPLMAAKAQERGIQQEDTMVLISRLKITLSDAIRIKTNPKIEVPELINPILKYDMQLSDKPVPNTIKVPEAKRMDKPGASSYTHNMVRLGFGNYISPLADLYLNMPGKKGKLGFYFNHLSANGPDLADFSRNQGGMMGEKWLKVGKLTGEVIFSANRINYYGFDSTKYQPNDAKEIRQRYQTLGTGIGFTNAHKKSKWGAIHLQYRFIDFRDMYFEQNEQNSNLKMDYGFKIKSHEIFTHIAWDLQRYNQRDTAANDSNLLNRNVIRINPHYVLKKKNWWLNLGFNAAFVGENGNTFPYFFPKVEGEYEITPNGLKTYGGISGDLIRNSFMDFANENPFIGNFLNLQNTVNRFQFNAGVRGKLTRNTHFTVGFRFRNLADMPLYITDTFAIRNMTIVYDDVNHTRLFAELQHHYSEKFRIAAKVVYNGFRTSTYEYAWQMPAFEGKLNASYNIADKLVIAADILVWGQRYAYTRGNLISDYRTLSPIIDGNVMIEYRWKKELSAFLRLNNIAAQRYEYYQHLPSLRLNGHLGVCIGF